VTEELATQAAQEVSANAEASAEKGTTEIENIRTEFEARFKGLQRVIAEKDEALQRYTTELSELKTAGLSEEEREQLKQTELKQRLDQLARENELLKLSKDYPEELPLFQKLVGAQDVKSQLDVIRELKAAIAQVQAPAAAPKEQDLEVSDVNPINPARREAPGVRLSDGRLMSDDIADRILKSFGVRD
jgi:hypothetical protein